MKQKLAAIFVLTIVLGLLPAEQRTSADCGGQEQGAAGVSLTVGSSLGEGNAWTDGSTSGGNGNVEAAAGEVIMGSVSLTPGFTSDNFRVFVRITDNSKQYLGGSSGPTAEIIENNTSSVPFNSIPLPASTWFSIQAGFESVECEVGNSVIVNVSVNSGATSSLTVNINTNGAASVLCQNGTSGANYSIYGPTSLSIDPCNANRTFVNLPSGIYQMVAPPQIQTKIGSINYNSKLVSVSPADTIFIDNGAIGTFNIEYKTLPVLDVH